MHMYINILLFLKQAEINFDETLQALFFSLY